MSTPLDISRSYVPSFTGEPLDTRVLVCAGMGGSAFPARVLRMLQASPYLISHQDYGLPPKMPPKAEYVAISYSGETEETLSFVREAFAAELPLSVITSGGTLLTFAREHGIRYVSVPSGLVPRDAVVVMSRALLALLGEDALLPADAEFDLAAAEREGEALASELSGLIPIVYASTRNMVISDLGKVLFNETAKVPSFANVFPEMNHNELQSFEGADVARFAAVFLKDGTDDERVLKRMALTERLLKERGVLTVSLELPSSTRAETFLYAWCLLRSSAQSLAHAQGVEPDATPLIEEFKRLL